MTGSLFNINFIAILSFSWLIGMFMTDLFILANDANGWGGNLVCLVHEVQGGGALPTPSALAQRPVSSVAQ